MSKIYTLNTESAIKFKSHRYKISINVYYKQSAIIIARSLGEIEITGILSSSSPCEVYRVKYYTLGNTRQ